MKFDELLGLEDIDAEEMVLVVGGDATVIGVENNGGNVFGVDTNQFQQQLDDGLKNNWSWVYGS